MAGIHRRIDDDHQRLDEVVARGAAVNGMFPSKPSFLPLLLAGAVSLAAAPPTFENTVQPFLVKHCYACHNARGNSGGLNLQDFTSAKAVMENRDEWEKVLRRISSGEMPPRKLPRPDAAELKQVTDWLQNEFDRADRNAKPNTGRAAARRLNRAEYNNTVQDLRKTASNNDIGAPDGHRPLSHKW